MLEIVEGLRIHRDERLEELLVTIEVLLVELNVKALLDPVQISHLVRSRVVVFPLRL